MTGAGPTASPGTRKTLDTTTGLLIRQNLNDHERGNTMNRTIATTETATAFVQPTADVSAPDLQVHYEPEPPAGPDAIRCLQYPHAMDLRGIPVICPADRAQRDWLLINQRNNVWIVCRCGHQWHEPELTRADYDALVLIPQVNRYTTVQAGLAAMGFDGTFAGLHL